MRCFFALALLFSLTAQAAGTNEDRISFARQRLMTTALSQAESVSSAWDPGQRDCAGLVRFVYRQAVAGPADIWRDRGGLRAAFLNAGELVGYNFTKLGSVFDPALAETGDLFVYHREDKKPEDAWHIMILLKPPNSARQDWLAIYHNGDSGPKGQVRVVSLKDLMTTVHGEWRPVLSNPAFRGVYRWNEWMSASKAR